MTLFLTLFSGVAWTTVYIDAIRVGFRDRSYAIPIAALALNISWETIYAVHSFATVISAQAFVNAAWAVADIVIVYTFLRFGRWEFPPFVSRPTFVAFAALVFASASPVQGLFIAQFGWMMAPRYTAFLQNLLMSGLFIAMFIARRGSRAQTLTIAIAKWLGTLAPTILFGLIDGSTFLLGLGILCSVFDIVYIGLLIWDPQRQPAAEGLNRLGEMGRLDGPSPQRPNKADRTDPHEVVVFRTR
jgi:hypothetical protein